MGAQWLDRGDLWKHKARALQLRFRDRFRVAVDLHLHRRKPSLFPDGYFSSTLNRWLLRFRHFRRDSLQSSTAFYRKRVCKDLDAEEESVILRMLQAVAVPVLGNVCHVFMNGLNRVQVYGVEKLHDALLNRPKNKPLITVSNHVASLDDPLVISSLLPIRVLLDAKNLRWTLCASDRCFRNPVTSAFFKSVKVLPVARGDGLYQKGMDMAVSKLNSGGWVHIFPEGGRSRDGGKTMGSSKRGVGRLVLDADNIPIVIPFVHTGMQEIMPIGANFPRVGKTVTVLVGDPIRFDDLVSADRMENLSRGKLYDAVASRIGCRLHELKVQVDELAFAQSIKLRNSVRNSERAAEILQQVDWELFGMGSHVFTGDETFVVETQVQPKFNFTYPKQQTSPNSRLRMECSYEGGIVSRLRGYMDPTELMGFAARGLFLNCRAKGNPVSFREAGPLRA
ncbi:Acyltransferase domain-containing protein [Cephalotus follicularis]|uniref:Tafazzin family protein n=1 Tax=Cephalotus follicularis TaxID=3775 RepID=A0A1Q3BRX3_CEPFO|nr:Acyltransferase domain-containing protein [Cephalotus follicularis]